MWIKYTIREMEIGTPQNLTLDKYSNGFTLKNTGNSICFLNIDPLQPGESKAIGGNKSELLTGRYRVYFAPIANPPVGYTQQDNAILTEKYYLPTPAQEIQLNC